MKKVFYGWYIVIAALLLSTYNSAIFVYGFTAFMTPIAKTFSWSYAQVSIASSLRGLETGTLDPLIGAAADRWPARRLMLIGICLFALGIFCISRATNLAFFYISFLITGLGSATSISMVPMTVIARWFRKNIGKASGIMAIGLALGGICAPLMVNAIIAYTWQNTLVYLAFGALIFGIPLSLLFRNKPEEYGLLPDGRVQGETDSETAFDFSTSVREALKMRSFWFIGIASLLQTASLHAVALHMIPYLTSVGIELTNAALAVSIFAMVSIPARIIYGVAADMFNKKYVMASSTALTVAGLSILGSLSGNSYIPVVIFACIHGFAAGGSTTIRMPVIREYFGTNNFGTIYGLVAVFVMLGVVAGAPIAGWVFDTRGIYDPIWLVYAGINLIATVLIMMLPHTSARSGPPQGQGNS
ncbi:MFS transporter [Chloroflexota bacterium]